MSSIVNSTLGNLCTYIDKDGVEYFDVPIIIDKNAAVKDAIGNIIGFEVIANVEKRYITTRPDNRDKFTDVDGNLFVVGQLRESTHSKWYFVVTEK